MADVGLPSAIKDAVGGKSVNLTASRSTVASIVSGTLISHLVGLNDD